MESNLGESSSEEKKDTGGTILVSKRGRDSAKSGQDPTEVGCLCGTKAIMATKLASAYMDMSLHARVSGRGSGALGDID